ncbi:hypothetical protein QBC40DRAFT_167895 [Triangularia verruculosa]|uniref:Uncharacterized protein n=1 Tax=Triangularia verruculosa TaxID=2587418 RepID=A0AAN7AYC7_9PEZI|nr:hypothetical protein QBC40DRAFT_167895 [Triangularia verruculosa]
MRGDAYDLQDLIKFSVTAVEWLLQDVGTAEKHQQKHNIYLLQHQFIRIVADLIQGFVKAVKVTRRSESWFLGNPEAISQHRMLVASQHPFLKNESLGGEDILNWEKRSELRLLPGEDGFRDWRVAKALFREEIRQCLCDSEGLLSNSIELACEEQDVDRDEDDGYDRLVDAFLDAFCPFKV